MPSGKPFTVEVARWPIAHTIAPSPGPKNSAAKNPGAESKAMVEKVLEGE